VTPGLRRWDREGEGQRDAGYRGAGERLAAIMEP